MIVEMLCLGAATAISILAVSWMVPYCIANGWYLGRERALRKATKESSDEGCKKNLNAQSNCRR